MAVAKKVVDLISQEPPQAPPSEPTEQETFLSRGRTKICDHITAGGGYKDAGDLYEALTMVLKQIQALFLSINMIVANAAGPCACSGELLNLCALGEDLAEETQRRVDRLYEEV